MSYPLNKIVNPETGYRVDVNGQIGKRVLRNYLNTMRGGGTKCEDVDKSFTRGYDINFNPQARKKCNNTKGCEYKAWHNAKGRVLGMACGYKDDKKHKKAEEARAKAKPGERPPIIVR